LLAVTQVWFPGAGFAGFASNRTIDIELSISSPAIQPQNPASSIALKSAADEYCGRGAAQIIDRDYVGGYGQRASRGGGGTQRLPHQPESNAGALPASEVLRFSGFFQNFWG